MAKPHHDAQKSTAKIDNIGEPNLKTPASAYEDQKRIEQDNELLAFNLSAQKENHSQSVCEFWILLIAKVFAVIAAFMFIGHSINAFTDFFYNPITYKVFDWHVLVVMIISITSGIIAALAILLKSLSGKAASNTSDDVPLPITARVLTEIIRLFRHP